MRVRICECSFHLTNCSARIPFRFGIHTMTEAPLCVARVVIEDDGSERATGYSSDLLVPKWFEKNPDQSIEDDWRRLCASAQAAADEASAETGLDTVYGHWRRLYATRVASTPRAEDLLVRGEGVSLVERALIDAACRLARTSFVDGLHGDLFGTGADARLSRTIESLPKPVRTIAVRHTVGLADVLDDNALPRDQRIKDGLPETLAEDVARYGLRHFKLKVSGDPEADLDRVQRIARVLMAHVSEPFITLDGNEQFTSIAALRDLLLRLWKCEEASWLLNFLVYVEQPLPRHRTFDAGANDGLRDLGWPCIIDEADFDEQSFPRAIELGYRGVSVKNCKGVFRALLNRGVCRERGSGCFQSGEDLTNLPVIALQQDLVTAAMLGLDHVERNGHHYFRGLNHLPPAEQQEALARHPDLYEQGEGGAHLRIRDGRLEIGSALDCVGYGYDVIPRVNERMAMEEWSPDTVSP